MRFIKMTKMKYFSAFIAIIAYVLIHPLRAQNLPLTASGVVVADLSDENKVRSVVYRLFDGMRLSDTLAIRELFTSGAVLSSTSVEPDGQSKLTNLSISDFMSQIGTATPGLLDERVKSIKVHIDDPLAAAWVEYDFYLNGQFHHCGFDAFQLFRTDRGWKIFQIADTRKKTGCLQVEQKIHQILDNWHKAAATADLDAYFDKISPDGRFLGTDASENWDKASFIQFAKPRFESGQAWNFTVKERNLYGHESGDIVWFDELLETWMGICRGSGVLVNTAGDWLIIHYNLSIMVPNELVQEYLDLLETKK